MVLPKLFSREFLCFSTIGVGTTAVHYAVLWGGVEILGFPVVAASTAGQALGAVVHYLLNYFVTFGSRGSHAGTIFRYCVVAGVGLGINSLLMTIMVYQRHWNYWLAQLVATVVVVMWSFTGSSMWTFRKPARSQAAVAGQDK